LEGSSRGIIEVLSRHWIEGFTRRRKSPITIAFNWKSEFCEEEIVSNIFLETIKLIRVFVIVIESRQFRGFTSKVILALVFPASRMLTPVKKPFYVQRFPLDKLNRNNEIAYLFCRSHESGIYTHIYIRSTISYYLRFSVA
jgi:hypothetical protein